MNQQESLLKRIAELEAAVGRLSLQIENSPFALEFPEPIATPLARESGATLHHERLFSLMDAGEASIKYTGVLAIALAIQSNQAFDLEDEFGQAPSLGSWVAIIRRLIPRATPNDSVIGEELTKSLYRPNNKPTPPARYLFDEFVSFRNEIERTHLLSF